MDMIFAVISYIFGLRPIAKREWKDFIVWPFLRIFWEPFSGKRSHWWHWQMYFGVILPSFDIPRNPEAGERALWTFSPSNLRQTNFEWKWTVVMQPVDYAGQYQVGFIAQEGAHYKQELCALVLEGMSAGLIGPYDLTFFAVSYPEGTPIRIQVVNIVRKDELTKDITLF